MDWAEQLWRFFQTGGWVMYPLLLLSVVSLTLSVERAIYWLRGSGPRTRGRVTRTLAAARAGDVAGARQIAEQGGGLELALARDLLDMSSKPGIEPSAIEPAAIEIIESRRAQIERFAPTLSTIITAAPLLGILGTVTGIIDSFELLGGETSVTDPAKVAEGIAEALYTTAFGLTVALVTLFPYAVFRVRIDRQLGRLEAVAATIEQAVRGKTAK